MADLVVAGAGMAGLAAAAEARRLGAEPLVLEKLGRPGGSMRLSSGVIWRHRDFDSFREECPDGDERLQRLLFERLDADLDWLESLGAPVVARETGNPLTTGTRFDPAGLTDALVEAVGRSVAGRPSAFASRRRTCRSCSPPAASRRTASCSRSTSRRRRDTPSCAPRPAAPATACASASRRAPPPAPGSTRSTPARCRRRPRGSPRTTSCGSRSSTRATRRSRTSAGRVTRRPRGPRSTWRSGSCASRVRARGSASRSNGSASGCASGRWRR